MDGGGTVPFSVSSNTNLLWGFSADNSKNFSYHQFNRWDALHCTVCSLSYLSFSCLSFSYLSFSYLSFSCFSFSYLSFFYLSSFSADIGIDLAVPCTASPRSCCLLFMSCASLCSP